MAKSVSRYISEILDAYQAITQKTCTEMAMDLTLPFPTSISIEPGKGTRGQTRLTKL